jgi:hypothetical protein
MVKLIETPTYDLAWYDNGTPLCPYGIAYGRVYRGTSPIRNCPLLGPSSNAAHNLCEQGQQGRGGARRQSLHAGAGFTPDPIQSREREQEARDNRLRARLAKTGVTTLQKCAAVPERVRIEGA